MSDSKRPNILWVSFEDTNPFYGCYGDPVARTPNLDQLATDGCRWPRAYSTAGVCAPARFAVITGVYAISAGTHHMRTTQVTHELPDFPAPYSAVTPAHVKCLPEYLRAAGYYCSNNIKTDYQFDVPLTAWDDHSLSAHWRNRKDPDQPFFSVFNLAASHESGMWQKKHIDLIYDPEDMVVPPYFPDTPKVRDSMARMYTHITNNDAILGTLLKQLEEDGLAENTVIFHWSDHGPMPRGKRWPYDSGIHVPMIVRWPGSLAPDNVSDDLVSTIDLAPTVLSLAGLEVPYHMQGQAFLGPKQATEPREYVHASRDRHDVSYDRVRAVRDKKFKYIRNYCPHLSRLPWMHYLNQHPIMQELWRLHLHGELNETQQVMFESVRSVEELYDTEADPYELNNLAADPAFADDLKRLQKEMDRWLNDVGDMGEIPEAEMVRRWYPDGKQPQTVAPVFVCINEEHPGIEFADASIEYDSPVILQIQSPTEGASVAYRFPDDEPDSWRLYTEPLRLKTGRNEVITKAVRIGYADSDEASTVVHVK
ncbi:sulfatase [Rubellicoccus peritrichatus]|uniref:Sulfatase n=1 Tax=Rubellicoccus peritrichatus TaxID=3080537 RepID=A0AAQ3QW28_9BACT|nr:sulfatase [Puniceicoccus sp. CR14]WOO41462.1 sulfatase [Puniceicoccus sp. CR14]